MAGELQFTIGARASCADGHCGEVRRIVFDPATGTVTHLVIQSGHREEAGRLVPVHLVETTDGGLTLRCTRAEFDQLEHAANPEEVTFQEPPQLVHGTGSGGTGVGMGMAAGAVVPGEWTHKTILKDVVPVGEDQVRPGDRVHAVDGEIGRVRGCLVDAGDDRVTHVLLREGHLWGRRQIAIPFSAVTGVEDGIRVSLTREQVGELPACGLPASAALR